jgi:hypothetical protein
MKKISEGNRMSNRIKGITISFSKDMSEEETQEIIDLIHHIRGVDSVVRYMAEANTFLDRARIKYELRDKVLEVFED